MKPAGGTNAKSFGPLLLNPGAFVAPRGLTFGNAGRNSLNNPRRWNWDMAMLKHIPVSERFDVEFRTEAFNVFNRAQLGSPVVALPSANFGLIQSSYNSNPTGSGTPREIQLMLRLDF